MLGGCRLYFLGEHNFPSQVEGHSRGNTALSVSVVPRSEVSLDTVSRSRPIDAQGQGGKLQNTVSSSSRQSYAQGQGKLQNTVSSSSRRSDAQGQGKLHNTMSSSSRRSDEGRQGAENGRMRTQCLIWGFAKWEGGRPRPHIFSDVSEGVLKS